MPVIDVELGSRTVEATLTLNITQLNDVLRVIVDQSNAHEAAIAELRDALRRSETRCSALEAVVSDLQPDQHKLGGLHEGLEALKAAVDELTTSTDSKLEQAVRRLGRRIEVHEEETKETLEHEAKRVGGIDQRACEALSLSQACEKRLDGLRIPDMGPVERRLEGLDASVAKAAALADASKLFLDLWSADSGAMQAALAQAAKSAHPSTVKAEYVVSLPPFQLHMEQGNERLSAATEATQEALLRLRHAMADKADLSQLSDARHGLEQELRKLQDRAVFLERRLKENEGLPDRVAGCEGGVHDLRRTKADASALEMKADAAAITAVGRDVERAQEDIEDLYRRLEKAHKEHGGLLQRSASSRGAAAAAAAPSSPSASFRSTSGTVAAGDDALRKRLSAVENEAARLDRDKADKSDVMALNDMVEALEGRLAKANKASLYPQPPSTPSAGAARRSEEDAGGPLPGDRMTPTRELPGAGTPTDHRRVLTPRRGGGGGPSNLPKSSPTRTVDSRPGSARAAMAEALRPMVSTPIASEQQPQKGGPGNSWHLARGSVTARDTMGASTPALISGGHVIPVVRESPAPSPYPPASP